MKMLNLKFMKAPKSIFAFSLLAAGLTLMVLPQSAEAAKLKGFSRKPSSQELQFNDFILNVDETDEVYFITLAKHAALYRFPKSKDVAQQAKEFFVSLYKSKKEVKLTIDPMTSEILFAEDLPK